jgi:hypothetical protein
LSFFLSRFHDWSCVGADDGQLRGLGFCGVEDRRGLMTTTEQASAVPTMAAFVIGGTGTMLFLSCIGFLSVHDAEF